MPTICLNANTIAYPTGGGHRWVYLNWALGLRSIGCRVVWLEGSVPAWGVAHTQHLVKTLKDQLRPYGLDDSLALYSFLDEPLPPGAAHGCLDFDPIAADADLLLDIAYGSREDVVRRFRRSALIDIDPGILQLWVKMGQYKLARHDTYFTIGETVGRPGSNLPDVGIPWHYVPPCVALDYWKPAPTPPGAPFTTVSQWRGGDWIVYGDESYSNEKRDGFLPFLDLPKMTRQPLELALNLGEWDDDERTNLESRGWRIRQSTEISSTPPDYHRYIQSSAGEFSCCKPSCVRLQNAWISDRTICYLASGKPAIVEHTGPSRFLPDAEGLFRFKMPSEAAGALDEAAANYAKHSAAARALAEEYFDAKRVTKRILEIALG
jgi:hypothetical protein